MGCYYEGLLRLCGFENDEIEREKPRIDKALQRLRLGPGDIKAAEAWVQQGHDIGLVGVRKLLGVWLKELIDLVLAKDEGKTVVYYGFPTIPGPGMAVKTASDKIYCACPDAILCHTLGQIFNKLTPVLEAGERNGLPPGQALCSLWQIRVGALSEKMIPTPDLVICSSYYCDMGSKADELLQQRFDHPAVYVDGSMDSRWGEYPDYLPERLDFLAAQLNKIFDTVKEVLGVEVNQEVWDRSVSTGRRLSEWTHRLTQLITADPMPISAAEVELALVLGASSTGRAMSDGPEALSILCGEVERRVEKGVGVLEKGAPKVLSSIDSFSDPSIANMMRDAGLAVCATFYNVRPSRPRTRSGPQATLGGGRAEWAMRDGLYHSSFAVVKRCEEAAKALDVDGVLWAYPYNCRPAAQISHMVKKWVEENAGVPTLPLEMDPYDSRNYSAESLRGRVEAFAEMLKDRKACA